MEFEEEPAKNGENEQDKGIELEESEGEAVIEDEISAPSILTPEAKREAS